MSDEDAPPALPAASGKPPERHWGNVAAGFSAGCALALSAYTAYLQRQQVKAQVWPILTWGFSATTVDDADAGAARGLAGSEADTVADSGSDVAPAGRLVPSFRFDLKNQGVGPALVRAMEVTYDDQPIRRWSELVPRLATADGRMPDQLDGHITLIHARVIAAGEETKPFEPYGDELVTAMYQALPHIAVKLCYCSVLEDCWEIRAQGFKDEPEPERVSRCFRPQVPFEQ